MKNKYLSKILAMSLAGAMIFGMSAPKVKAEDPAPTPNAHPAAVTKVLKVPAGTEVPKEMKFTFEFKAKDINGEGFNKDGLGTDKANMPTLGTATATAGTGVMSVTYKGGTYDNIATSDDGYKYLALEAGDFMAKADGSAIEFPGAGVYTYEITEKTNTYTDGDKGTYTDSLKYADKVKYTVKVEVKYDTDGTTPKVNNVIVYPTNDGDTTGGGDGKTEDESSKKPSTTDTDKGGTTTKVGEDGQPKADPDAKTPGTGGAKIDATPTNPDKGTTTNSATSPNTNPDDRKENDDPGENGTGGDVKNGDPYDGKKLDEEGKPTDEYVDPKNDEASYNVNGLTFTNLYTVTPKDAFPDSGEEKDGLNDAFFVQKFVKGTYANKDKYFTFTIQLKDLAKSHDYYGYVMNADADTLKLDHDKDDAETNATKWTITEEPYQGTDAAAAEDHTIDGTSHKAIKVTSGANQLGTAVTVKLKHGQRIVFPTVPAGVQFKVTEAADAQYMSKADYYSNKATVSDGTTTYAPSTVNVVSNDAVNMAATVEKNVTAKSTGAKYLNTLDPSKDASPTGIIVNNLPFAMLIAVSALLLAAYVFIKSRRREMES